MSYIDLFLIGVGLSMDAFAVSVCKGLSMSRVNKKQCFLIALFFGGFQALMPLLGWLLGTTVVEYIRHFDHWIAFVLLLYVGGKMIVDAIREWKDDDRPEYLDMPLHLKELFLLAVATSIDAFAVGITFSFLEVVIWTAIAIIGVTTFVLSAAGVYIGNLFGGKFKSKAQLAGGIILIALGARILVTHLMGLA
jgi:putative Mn2+ efflux pump MntP